MISLKTEALESIRRYRNPILSKYAIVITMYRNIVLCKAFLIFCRTIA